MAKNRVAVREIIGRVANALSSVLYPASYQSVDKTVTNYRFWDELRRGKLPGFEFSGLLVRPIAQISTAWVLGNGVQAKLAEAEEYTDNLLQRWMTSIHSTMLQFIEDLYSLGDQYVVINPDGSISVPSPDTVVYKYSDLDYRQPVSATITTVQEKVTIIDEYRLDGRTLTIKYADDPNNPEVYEYPNLIGVLPVIHFANERGTNETHGRPLMEAMYTLLSKYNDLFKKLIGGAELMGNPFPVIEGAEDPDEVLETNGEEVEENDSQGNIVTRWVLNFKRMTSMVLGKGASLKLVSPGNGFTDDIRNVLKAMFLLVMDFTRIPEVIWGNELSSSRASAGEQMQTFYQHVEHKRVALEGQGTDDLLQIEARGGIFQMIDIWLRYRSLTDRQVKVAPVILRWPELNSKGDEMRLKWTEFLRGEGLLPDEETVAQSDLVEDVATIVEKAKEEAQERRDQFENAVDEQLNQPDTDDETDDEELDVAA